MSAMSFPSRRRAFAVLGVALALATSLTHAKSDDSVSWRPQSVFVQGGIARDAKTLALGATWASAWQRPLGGGLATIYWEASFGRWEAERDDGSSSSAWITQLGITPVLRWLPGGSERSWFLEGGIGANVLLPVYRSRDKRFSTAFNFGDHIAVGRRFGENGEHEIALRLQHFSNAGIKHPNPGEDFLQLRYARRF